MEGGCRSAQNVEGGINALTVGGRQADGWGGRENGEGGGRVDGMDRW